MDSSRSSFRRLATCGALVALVLAPASLVGQQPQALTNEGIVAPPVVPSSRTFQGTDYTDFGQYESAAGSQTCIDFTDLSEGTTVTTQYLAQGVEFTDGDDTILPSSAFVQDGQGLRANGRIHLLFAEPRTSLGVFFPRALVIEVFDVQNGTSLHTSQQYAGSGTGHFGGVVTTTPFTFVKLRDPVGGCATAPTP